MRGISAVFAVSLAALSAAGAGMIRADAPCSGDACSVLAVAGDGCAWTNKGNKAVRFLLIAGETARVLTVLAPGETFKEADKAYCLSDKGDRRYQATFAVLAKMPDEDKPALKTATPRPRAKPALTAAPASAVGEVAVASVGASVPLPRAKPQPAPARVTPLPRVKPEAVVGAAPVAAVAPSAPVAPAATSGPLTCERDCPPILFKVIDDCLWVLNLNPRPVVFEADAGGTRRMLMLEAADGAKADERTAALSNAAPPKNESSAHMRLKDPFQSAGSGIPVYRARLGAAGACVKSRDEVSAFTARYAQ